MEMSIYEQQSLSYSISNLAMIKAFHDAGLDSNKFSNVGYLTDVQSSMDPSFEILLTGLSELYEDIQGLDWYDLKEKPYKEMFDETPEQAILIKDPLIDKILSSPYRLQLEICIENASKGNLSTEADTVILKENNLLAVQVWFPGMLHEVAVGLIEVKEKALELSNMLEEKNKNGIQHQNNRPAA